MLQTGELPEVAATATTSALQRDLSRLRPLAAKSLLAPDADSPETRESADLRLSTSPPSSPSFASSPWFLPHGIHSFCSGLQVHFVGSSMLNAQLPSATSKRCSSNVHDKPPPSQRLLPTSRLSPRSGPRSNQIE